MHINRTGALRHFIGDRAFYRRAATIVLPMIVQNTITNVVSLLDNVMVGQVGTLPMSAVAVVNQLLFIFNLCVFATVSAAGIFSTQYAGAGDYEGMRSCMRIKLVIGGGLLLIAGGIFLAMPHVLIRSYLTEADPETAAATMGYALSYLRLMLPGLIPFVVTQVYASSMREDGQTRLPMVASVTSIIVNLVFNWLLIFGVGPFPAMGVEGAAIATVLSRFVEMGIVIIGGICHRERYPYLHGMLTTLRAPVSLWKQVARKGMPLIANEFLWSTSIALILQCYSKRGVDVVAASNIASTMSGLFNVLFISMGGATGIMVGQALGAGRMEEASDTAWQLLTISVVGMILMAVPMILLSDIIPKLYDTEPEIRHLAGQMLRIMALTMPMDAVANNCYFTIRSGGRMIITFLFDSVFSLVFDFGCAAVLAYLTEMPIVPMYFCVQMMHLLKAILSIIVVKHGGWKRQIITGLSGDEKSV